MIKYVLYIWNTETKKYCYHGEIEYQAKIIRGEHIRYNMMRFIVNNVDHDLDANVIDLYLEKEVT